MSTTNSPYGHMSSTSRSLQVPFPLQILAAELCLLHAYSPDSLSNQRSKEASLTDFGLLLS